MALMIDQKPSFHGEAKLWDKLKAYLPNNEKIYLKNLYGDFMKIPPEDKREYHYLYALEVNGEIL